MIAAGPLSRYFAPECSVNQPFRKMPSMSSSTWQTMTTRAARWLALIGLLLGAATAPRAQVVLRKDLQRDFGAVGDGRTND